MEQTEMENAVLRAIDIAAIERDLAHIVQVPSITGNERAVVERFGEFATSYGLAATLHDYDLAALRAHPDFPGDEAARDELVGCSAVLTGGASDGLRICLDGHLDVVDPGTVAWQHGPWSGAVEHGYLYGRGSADMKGGVIAALHAVAAVKRALGEVPGDIVLEAVPSEEDGGAGTFAALQRDANYAACLIPEPSNLTVCCAHAGALTFVGSVPGVSAHAALRLEGISALDRYVPIHQALWEYERQVNSNIQHPLMAALALPYPIVVGRIEAGAWSSQVPDLLRFEGRVGVKVGQSIPDAITAFEDVVRTACPEVEITWSGGKFAPAETPIDHPLVGVTRDALGEELERPAPLRAFPAGADMRLFTARGIPTVMVGTNGLELAHAVNERVSLAEVYQIARVLARSLVRLQWGDVLRPSAAS